MARRQTRSRVVGVRPQRQPTNWARAVPTASFALPAATKVLVVIFELSNPGIGETIRRTHVELAIGSDQGTNVEDQVGAFGGIVVNDLAVAAGAASIPGPGTDASDDGWFLHQTFAMQGFKGLRSAGASYPDNLRYEIDSKAMRRVEEGFTVAFMIENLSSTFGMEAVVGVSMLTSLS